MPNQISCTLAVDSCCIQDVLRPDLAGRKVRVRGETPIYLVDPDGYRRLVPFPHTFMNLFADRVLLQVQAAGDIADIPEGPALDNGTMLLRGISCERFYLLDHGRRRLITSRRIMEKYEFTEEATIVVPRVLIDAIPEGEIWE